MAAMREGDFAAAWAVSDAVLAARDPAERDDPRLPYHQRWVWDGHPFAGRHVLVRCYHGLGDTIMCARFLPALRPLVASLTLEAAPALTGLLARLPGPDRILPFRDDAPAPPAECDLEIMELPHALRLRPEPHPYLSAPAPRVARTRARLGAGGPKIGLCWQAGDWDPDRSVPLPALLDACAQPGVRLFSLQRGPAAVAGPFLNPDDRSLDVLDTAALIAALDLVVTVDTMVAHLAGALGRPVRLLLKHDADWRWLERRRDSPWYGSMRLYRQPAPGDWRTLLAELAADLSPPPAAD